MMWAQLKTAERALIETAIGGENLAKGPGGMGFASNKQWWQAQSEAQRHLAAGLLAHNALGSPASGNVMIGTTSINPTDYSDDYDRLRPAAKARVDKSGDALSGRAMMPPTEDEDEEEEEEEEAPALPIAGIAILGSLLAGRGWWLRRRQQA